MDLFNKQQIAVLHGIRRGFVKELLKSIGPTDVIEHYSSRVKENDSIADKLWAKQLNATTANAIEHLTDIIGVRIVVHFIGDVYDIVSKVREKYDIMEEIDRTGRLEDGLKERILKAADEYAAEKGSHVSNT